MDESERELLARCAPIGTSTWSDALDEVGIAGIVEGIVQRSGSGRMVGFAVTARQVPGRLDEFDKAEFAVGRLVAATGPGRVLMVDMGGEPISTLGGLASYASRRREAAGVVIDGACRDVDEIRATGLWLASRWVTPRTGKRRLRLQPLGVPVVIGGVAVAQGDLVVGDDTGIVVVPRARLDEVLARALRILAVDEAVEARLRQGESFADAAAAAGYLPLPADGRP